MNKEKLKDVGAAVLIVLILIAAGMAFVFILNPQPQSSQFTKWVSGSAVVNSNITIPQSNNTMKQNETNVLNAQVIGYDTLYNLTITAESGTSTHMVKQMEFNISSWGVSAVSIYIGQALVVHKTFNWHTILYYNVSEDGLYTMTINISSATLAVHRSLVYSLDFQTAQQYISYENAQSQATKQPFYTSATLWGSVLGAVTVALSLFAYNEIDVEEKNKAKGAKKVG